MHTQTLDPISQPRELTRTTPPINPAEYDERRFGRDSYSKPEPTKRGLDLNASIDNFNQLKNAVIDLGGATLEATGELFSQISGWERNPAPDPLERNSENGNAEISEQAVQEEQQVRYEKQYFQTLVRNDEALQQQKGEEALKESQRLEVDAAAIVENLSGRSSRDRVKGEIKPLKIESNRSKTLKEMVELRAYDMQFESQQRGWAEDIVEDTQKEESVATADNQAVVNLNAVMEGGTGGAKANIAPVTGAG